MQLLNPNREIWVLRVSGASLAMFLSACSEGPSRGDPTWAVIDSAGVEIVHSSGSPDRQLGGWSISDQPRLVIATDPTDPDQVVHWVRDAVRLSDGRIAFISESSKNLLFYDGSGTLVQIVGKDGDGPGEFRAPILLSRLAADTLVVTERSNRRSWFSPQGEFLRQVIPDRLEARALAPAGFSVGFAWFVPRDGNLWELSQLGLGPVGRRYRQTRGFVFLPSTGEDPVLLGWFQGLEHFFVSQGLGGPAFFARDTHVALAENPTRIYVGDSEVFEVRRFDSTGSLDQIIRDSEHGAPVTDRDIQRERQALLMWGESMGMLPEFTRLADAMPVPEVKPCFEAILVDSEGSLWVEEYSGLSPDLVRYRVYSPDGRRIGALGLPGRLLVFDIGADYILGKYTDLNDVETVQLFDLGRPQGANRGSDPNPAPLQELRSPDAPDWDREVG